jgi:hypothetical protein
LVTDTLTDEEKENVRVVVGGDPGEVYYAGYNFL